MELEESLTLEPIVDPVAGRLSCVIDGATAAQPGAGIEGIRARDARPTYGQVVVFGQIEGRGASAVEGMTSGRRGNPRERLVLGFLAKRPQADSLFDADRTKRAHR